MKTVGILVGVMLAGLAVLLGVGEYMWRGESQKVRERLVPAAAEAPRVQLASVDSLPAPVARYLRAVLRDGDPMPAHVRITEAGEFLTRPNDDGWGRFTATHDIVRAPAGFLWDAKIRMGPGLSVRVRDSFVGGEGAMFGSLMGYIPVVNSRGTPAMSQASLQRWLAEAVWAPGALLPASGVRWAAIDDTSARATVTSGGTTVSLDFFFGADGLVSRIYSPARAREFNGKTEPTPWQGRWSDYAERGGVKVPTRGEVEWLLPEGPQVYWKGRVETYATGAPRD